MGVLLSRLEFADDAALIESIDKASERISSIAKGSRELADMEVRMDKTETMFPRDDECGWEVTFNEYEEVEWNHTCEYCGRGFDEGRPEYSHWCTLQGSERAIREPVGSGPGG